MRFRWGPLGLAHRGIVAVEAVAVLFAVIVFLTALVDLGRLGRIGDSLTNAARIGARIAVEDADTIDDAESLRSAVVAALVRAARRHPGTNPAQGERDNRRRQGRPARRRDGDLRHVDRRDAQSFPRRCAEPDGQDADAARGAATRRGKRSRMSTRFRPVRPALSAKGAALESLVRPRIVPSPPVGDECVPCEQVADGGEGPPNREEPHESAERYCFVLRRCASPSYLQPSPPRQHCSRYAHSLSSAGERGRSSVRPSDSRAALRPFADSRHGFRSGRMSSHDFVA